MWSDHLSIHLGHERQAWDEISAFSYFVDEIGLAVPAERGPVDAIDLEAVGPFLRPYPDHHLFGDGGHFVFILTLFHRFFLDQLSTAESVGPLDPDAGGTRPDHPESGLSSRERHRPAGRAGVSISTLSPQFDGIDPGSGPRPRRSRPRRLWPSAHRTCPFRRLNS